MRKRVLSETRFKASASGWRVPKVDGKRFVVTGDGLVLDAPEDRVQISGSGVHTRNGDAIELHFRLLVKKKGRLRLGFSGGMESAMVTLDFARGQAVLHTSDWTAPQPEGQASFTLGRMDTHVLQIEKTEGRGDCVKLANLCVTLDGKVLLKVCDVNVLPELGVAVGVQGTRILLKRFVQRGVPSGIPEFLHVGGWQVLNRPSIAENLDSICRGVERAAEKGVQLLLTPETSLTGLFPTDRVTQNVRPVRAAEKKLQEFIKGVKNAPYVVVGMPVWESMPEHRRKRTRYNVSRVYDPDGAVVLTGPKIHSCETEFWHGYGLNEFDVFGAPVCMHVCHDGRYPETWTLPVMFGARLILHPSNGGTVSGSVDAFEKGSGRTTSTSHAFYLRVNGGGGSCLAGPDKFNNVLAVSEECRRNVATFPMVGPPQECLFDAKIRLHDAFGYWPVRSFRASEDVASAYVSLYRARGGQRV